MVALLRGDQDGARAWYDKAVAIDPSFPQVYRRIADVYFDRRQYAEALNYYEKSLERLPRDFRSLLQAGNAARALGQNDLGQKYYLRAQLVRPDSWVPAYNLACLLAATRDTEGALDRLKKAVDNGMPAQIAMQDKDMLPLRPKPRFAALLKSADRHAVLDDD
jgi:tetratricopeptide (TPR) repeat protein